MPLPEDPNAPRPPAQRPAQVLLNSPLAASSRMLNQRARKRPQPPVLWRRVFALAGSLLVHLVFLFAFILGPAWEPPPVGEAPPAKLKLRFIELPELAPPPPPKGEPPRRTGPVHQGHAAANPGTRRSANVASQPVQRPPAAAAQAVAVPPAKAVAAPLPPPSLPQPAPTPQLQPVPLANQPPPVNLPKPVLQPPVPPKFQPQPVRAPQAEGNQPMPPPPSLAMPALPPQAPPTIAPPSVALDRVAPNSAAPAIAQPMHVDLPAAPPAPELQAVPLPAQAAPQVSLQTSLNAPAPNAPQRLPKLQAPAPVQASEQPLAAIPQTAPATPTVAPAPKAALEIANQAALTRISQPAPVALSSGETTPAPASAATTAPATATASPSNEVAAKPGETNVPDFSTAPNANPQGSDTARPGEPQGSASASETATVHGNGPVTSHGLGHATTGAAGKGEGTHAGSAAGAAGTGAQPSGQAPGNVPEYVQLKPTGDTTVMRHQINGVNYKATRFDPYWTPEGESSVDTALRHAAEKTTLQHTFHLPRGIRIKCKVMPLVPVALLGCGDADSPPPAASQKVYDRLNLPAVAGGSVPSAPSPAPAASTAKPARVVLDNSVQCAEARVAGGIMPPGCPSTEPVVKRQVPAASSSSWVPASDQFH